MATVFPEDDTEGSEREKVNIIIHPKRPVFLDFHGPVDPKVELSSTLTWDFEVVKEKTETSAMVSVKSNTFAGQRDALRDNVIDDILASALPEDEEIVNIVEGIKVEEAKPSGYKAFITKWGKNLGLIPLTLKEAVNAGSIRSVDKALDVLIEQQREGEVNERDENGQSLLSLAVKIRNVDIVRSLLHCKADPNLPDLKNGQTPIFYAICIPPSETSKDRRRLNRRQIRKIKKMCIYVESVELVDVLLEKGADCNVKDKNGVTPLMLACLSANMGFTPLGEPYDETAKYSKSLSYYYSQMNETVIGNRSNLPIVKKICPRQKNVDAKDYNGWTALHYAALGNSSACCSYLINEFGADREIKDKERRKPCHIAKSKGYGDCVAVLDSLKSKLVG